MKKLVRRRIIVLTVCEDVQNYFYFLNRHFINFINFFNLIF